MSYYYDSNTLAHYGVSGQKWGVRRYQNEDGSLTQLGKEHYSISSGGNSKFGKKYSKEMHKLEKLSNKADIDVQTKAAEKHEKRAETTKKIGNAALKIAIPAVGAAGLSKAVANRSIEKNLIDTRNNLVDVGNRIYRGQKTDWSRAANNAMENYYNSAHKIDNAINVLSDRSIRDTASSIYPVASMVGIATGAAAATMYGASAYNKLAAKVNKHRLTDKGHAKAVARMEAQYNKVTNMVKGTSYMSLFKDQIDAYKKEHPNTELSDKQIMKNLM